MNKTLQKTLLSNWHPMRWLAFVAGSLFVGMGIWHTDIISVLVGGLFLFQAATNTGCLCGNCAVTAQATIDSSSNNVDEIKCTEVKED
jgi:hypothetical protein